MTELLSLIRIRTLAFTVFTLYVIRLFVVERAADVANIQLLLDKTSFSLLVIAVCLMVSAAYIINDYFDAKADSISGVKTIIVGKVISRRVAIILHSILNLLSVILSFVIGFMIDKPLMGIVFILMSALLWLYSLSYRKRHTFASLIIIGIMYALIPFCPLVFELPCAEKLVHVYYSIGFYSLCFFVLGILYNIDKDMFSYNGDKAMKYNTLVVKYGIKKSASVNRYLMTFLILIFVSVFVMHGSMQVSAIDTTRITLYYVFCIAYVALGLSYLFVVSSDNRFLHLLVLRSIMVLTILSAII